MAVPRKRRAAAQSPTSIGSKPSSSPVGAKQSAKKQKTDDSAASGELTSDDMKVYVPIALRKFVIASKTRTNWAGRVRFTLCCLFYHIQYYSEEMISGLLALFDLPGTVHINDELGFLKAEITKLQAAICSAHIDLALCAVYHTKDGLTFHANVTKERKKKHKLPVLTPDIMRKMVDLTPTLLRAIWGPLVGTISQEIWAPVPGVQWGNDIVNALTDLSYRLMPGLINAMSLGLNDELNVHNQLLELKQISDPRTSTKKGWPSFALKPKFDHSDFDEYWTPHMAAALHKELDAFRKVFQLEQQKLPAKARSKLQPRLSGDKAKSKSKGKAKPKPKPTSTKADPSASTLQDKDSNTDADNGTDDMEDKSQPHEEREESEPEGSEESDDGDLETRTDEEEDPDNDDSDDNEEGEKADDDGIKSSLFDISNEVNELVDNEFRLDPTKLRALETAARDGVIPIIFGSEFQETGGRGIGDHVMDDVMYQDEEEKNTIADIFHNASHEITNPHRATEESDAIASCGTVGLMRYLEARLERESQVLIDVIWELEKILSRNENRLESIRTKISEEKEKREVVTKLLRKHAEDLLKTAEVQDEFAGLQAENGYTNNPNSGVVLTTDTLNSKGVDASDAGSIELKRDWRSRLETRKKTNATNSSTPKYTAKGVGWVTTTNPVLSQSADSLYRGQIIASSPSPVSRVAITGPTPSSGIVSAPRLPSEQLEQRPDSAGGQ